jgi:hypothetical protein
MDNYDETVADLTAARHDTGSLSTKQVIKVELKKDIKKRIGRSPDSGEALLLAFYEPTGSGAGHLYTGAGHLIPTGSAVTLGRRDAARWR